MTYIAEYGNALSRMCSGRDQLPAEDGAGEDCLPAVWLSDRPVEVGRLLWGHAPTTLQR